MLPKKIFWFFAVILLFSSAVYADVVSFRTYRESYNPFESVQLDVVVENATLSRELVASNLGLIDLNGVPVAVARNILKINESFYAYYFDVPDIEPGVYSLKLSSVSYVKDGSNLIGEFSHNLTVADGRSNIVSVRPAYYVARINSGQEISLSLFISNKGDNSVNIVLDEDGEFFNFQQDRFSLSAGASRNVGIFASTSDSSSPELKGKIFVNYAGGRYEIPFLIFISGLGNVEEPRLRNISSTERVNLEDAIYVTTLYDTLLDKIDIPLDVRIEYASGQVLVKNNLSVDLHDVNYSFTGLNGLLKVEPEESSIIPAGSSVTLTISVDRGYEFANGVFDGTLNILSRESKGYSLPVAVRVSGVREIIEETINVTDEINVSAPPAVEEKKTNIALWLFILFIIILLLVLLYIYRKTRAKKEEFEGFIENIKSRR